MSNTLAGVNLAALAQKTLETLLPQLPNLSVFSTDFSADPAIPCSTISTRVATATTSGSLATGYATNAQNVTTGIRTITLGALTGQVVGFTDAEMTLTSINLPNVFVRPGVNAIAKGFVDAVLANVTASNYTTAAFTGAAAEFTEDKVAEIAQALTDAKVPLANRTLVLNSAYFTALLKQPAVKAAYAYGGSEAIRGGMIPNLSGMKIVQYPALSANSENLVGFACAPEAMICAARLPAIPANFPGEIQTVTDPESGFSLQLRRWYSPDAGVYYMSMASIYGSAVGNAGNLVRIVSA